MRKYIYKGMAALAAVFALAGCQKEGAQTDPAREIDWSRAKFVVDATAEDGAQTRALKTEWNNLDMIAVIFGGERDRYAILQYNGAAQEWTLIDLKLDGLDPDGGDAVSALHSAPNVSLPSTAYAFSCSESDLLYTDAGSYTADVSDPDAPTVRLTLTMERAATTAIVMNMPAGAPTSDQWRLWGNGLSMQSDDVLLAPGEPFTSLDEHIRALFAPTASDRPVRSDPMYPYGKAVFHVMSTLGADAPVTFNVFKDKNINGTVDPEETVYTRTFTGRELTVGATVEFDGPTMPGAIATGKWQPVDGTLITPAPLTGIVAPVAGNTPQPAGTPLPGGTEYTAKSGLWADKDGMILYDNFVAGTVYRAEVLLTPKEGFIFGDIHDNDDAVQGFLPADAESIEYSGRDMFDRNTIRLWIYYTATAGGDE